MFWGGETIRANLASLISDFDPKRLDRAAYRLRVWPEVYVSPTDLPGDPKNKPKAQLKPDEGFTIPAGQFAFLLTEEVIRVPDNALAFISVRASYKFRGLVNVSGFHVDPGYHGRLIFSVFNAGPAPVHLSRGEECFQIWYATLDGPSNKAPKIGFDLIPSSVINPIAGEIQSFAGLSAKIEEGSKKLSDRVTAIEREQAVIKWAAPVIITLLGMILFHVIRTSGANVPVPTQPIAGAPSAISMMPSVGPHPMGMPPSLPAAPDATAPPAPSEPPATPPASSQQ